MKKYDHTNMQIGDIAIAKHYEEFHSFKIARVLPYSRAVESDEGVRYYFEEVVEVMPTSRPVREVKPLETLQDAYGFTTDSEMDELFKSLHNMNVQNLQMIAVDNNDHDTFQALGGLYQ